MENDASREDIANRVTFGIHVLDIDDLWCNKARSATSDEQILLFLSVGRQSKIANRKILRIILPKNYILGLEVAVDYFVFRKMPQSFQNITHYLLYLLSLKFFTTPQHLVELLPLQILQDNIDGVLGFIHSFQFHDVSVAEHSHQFYLVLQRLSSLFARVLLLFRKCLYCNHFMVTQPFC